MALLRPPHPPTHLNKQPPTPKELAPTTPLLTTTITTIPLPRPLAATCSPPCWGCACRHRPASPGPTVPSTPPRTWTSAARWVPGCSRRAGQQAALQRGSAPPRPGSRRGLGSPCGRGRERRTLDFLPLGRRQQKTPCPAFVASQAAAAATGVHRHALCALCAGPPRRSIAAALGAGGAAGAAAAGCGTADGVARSAAEVPQVG